MNNNRSVEFGRLCNKIASATTPDVALLVLSASGVSEQQIDQLAPKREVSIASLFSTLELYGLVKEGYIRPDFRSELEKHESLTPYIKQCFDDKTMAYNVFQLRFTRFVVPVIEEVLLALKMKEGVASQFRGRAVQWTEIWCTLALTSVRFNKDNVASFVARLRASPDHAKLQHIIALVEEYEHACQSNK